MRGWVVIPDVAVCRECMETAYDVAWSPAQSVHPIQAYSVSGELDMLHQTYGNVPM